MAQTDVVLIIDANTGIGYQIVGALASSKMTHEIIVAGTLARQSPSSYRFGKGRVVVYLE